MPALLDTADLPARTGLRPHVRVGWLSPLAVLAWTLFNAAYVACWCPHDLAPDEAHYWDWSRHLDWGYYSKGPLIAWLIRGGCLLFGDTPFGVRSVAVACGGLVLLGLWRLTRLCTGCHRTALGVTLVAMAHPAASAAGVIATIDGPFLACWVWAAVAGFRKRWVFAGLLVAVGTLAKPTMLLFPACVLLLAVLRPEWRSRRVGWFFGLSLFGLVPQIAWNAAHDWVSVRHLFAHAGNGGEAAPWYSPLAFVGGQFALLLGVWFVLWVRAAWRFRPWRGDANSAFLWCLSVPVFGVFLIASVKTAGELNWPVAAYLSGAVLVARMWWASWLAASPGRTPPATTSHRVVAGSVRPGEANPNDSASQDVVSQTRRGTALRVGPTCLVALAVVASVVIRWPNLVRPALATVLPQSEDSPPVRRLDPTARLAGWRTLAKAVDEVRADLDDPLIATMAWTVPGELAFYCDGQPPVYTFAPAVGDRFSQYDVWRPNPVADAQEFRGRTFVYVGTELPHGVFERIERVRRVTHTEGGVPVASWTVWVGRGYRGFDHAERKPPRY
jgi:hypothetical protein